jgi:predicted dehydrogenase
VRILIAGLGAIGQRHARNLRALGGDSLALSAFRRRRRSFVVTETLTRDDSVDVERALALETFGDLDEALAVHPDAVFVCTPSAEHVEIAQRAADAGCHLFVEKPLSHTIDGVERLRETVASRGLIALVGCQWRYHPRVRWLRTQIDAGALGDLRHAEIEYQEYLPDWHPYEDYRQSYAARTALGGGVVLTQIHDYDLAWWLFGPLRRVTALGGHLSDLEIDVEDTVEASFDGPVRVRVTQTFARRPPRRAIGVAGTRGAVRIDLLTGAVDVTGDVAGAPELHGYRRNDMFVDEARHFLACLAGKERPAVPLGDGIQVLRVALAVKEALHSAQPVEIA